MQTPTQNPSNQSASIDNKRVITPTIRAAIILLIFGMIFIIGYSKIDAIESEDQQHAAACSIEIQIAAKKWKILVGKKMAEKQQAARSNPVTETK